jgi:hypothetical protein
VQRLKLFLFVIQSGRRARKRFGALIGDPVSTEFVISLRQSGDPGTGATDAFGNVIGNSSFGNKIESLPANLLPSLLTFSISLVELVSCEMRFECNWAWHIYFYLISLWFATWYQFLKYLAFHLSHRRYETVDLTITL